MATRTGYKVILPSCLFGAGNSRKMARPITWDQARLFEIGQKIQEGLAFGTGKIGVTGHLGAGVKLTGLVQGNLKLVRGKTGADAVEGRS